MKDAANQAQVSRRPLALPNLRFPRPAPLALAVVIPARDEAEMLAQNLPELLAALLGVPFPFRLFVIDDGSRDGTAEVARRHGAVLLRGECRGPGAARNQGAQAAMAWLESLGMAQGGWLLFLDADCRVTPDHFTRIHGFLLEARTRLVAVQERHWFSRWSLNLGSSLKRACHAWLYRNFSIPIVHAGCLYVRAGAFIEAGGFDSDNLFEDIDLGLRFDSGSIRMIQEPIVTEIGERRLRRVGSLASLTAPTRWSGILFITYQLAPCRYARWLLRAFRRLGPDRLPIRLWWHDPQGVLRVRPWQLAMVVALWILLLVLLKTGVLTSLVAPNRLKRLGALRSTGPL